MSIKSSNKVRNTFGSVMERTGGFASGFDYLRVTLAVAVILWHVLVTTRSDVVLGDLWESILRPFPALILPMFFCLSGFLVAGSLKRTKSIREFLLLRAIRIVPALVVETFLSAIILGMLLTTLPLHEYLTSNGFWLYFLNILGRVHISLPGVFSDNIFPNVVNANLWTLPSEFECYALLSLLVILKITEKPLLLLSLICIVIFTYTIIIWPEFELLQRLRPHPRGLIVAFLLGVLFYFQRETIPHGKYWFFSALLITLILLLSASLQFLALPFLAYVTVYIGLLNPPKRTFLLRGDYSYGLYLFGFPLQQLYSYLWPTQLNWLYNICFTLVLGTVYAYFSWNYVEKPILLKKSVIIAWFNLRYQEIVMFFSKPSRNLL